MSSGAKLREDSGKGKILKSHFDGQKVSLCFACACGQVPGAHVLRKRVEMGREIMANIPVFLKENWHCSTGESKNRAENEKTPLTSC
ncbi:hypothetical protein [Desulfobaculum bizertense]|uniref:hypothetical protein n=1 Tax=Desulfobaculum bizertense TaxID=376490 RepID=UPI00117E895D|nr:hypothetical protein [Desulfobaculum bizertense]